MVYKQSLAGNLIFVSPPSFPFALASRPMSPNSSSSESSAPCSQFTAGAGRKGDRCSTCYEKEQQHHFSTTNLPHAAAAPSESILPSAPHLSGSANSLGNSAPQTATVSQTQAAPPSSVDVHAIINRYATGMTGRQLRPRLGATVTPIAMTRKSEALSGFRKKKGSSSFPKVCFFCRYNYY